MRRKKIIVSDKYKAFKVKTFREVKSYDIIEGEGARDWARDNMTELKSDLKFNMPLNEGVIRLPIKANIKTMENNNPFVKLDNGVVSYIYFQSVETEYEDEHHIILEHYVYSKDTYAFEFMIRMYVAIQCGEENGDEYLTTNFSIMNVENDNEHLGINTNEEEKMANTTLEMFYGVILAMNYIAKEKDTVIKTVACKKHGSKKSIISTFNNKRTVEIFNKDKVIYSITGSRDSLKSFRSYTRHIQSWSVVGHYRHYKNGKTIWIKPCTRGVGKKIKPKTYKIELKEDGG